VNSVAVLLMRTVATTLVSLAIAVGVWAAPTACPENFLDGEAPDVVAPEKEVKTQELCYLQFAVLHSGVTRTPLWSAEHLTRERVDAAGEQKRQNAFHPEANLPPEDRAELADYVRSGYDRGHMAPSGDMPDSESQRESFTLANMIPQNPNNNRGLWSRVESAVRDLARSDGEVYVLTGPVFQGNDLPSLHDRITVPTQIYKAVYDPARKAAGVYLVDNAFGNDWQVISVAELRNLTGLDVFPKLEPPLKDHAMALPGPVKDRAQQGHGR
jgi:endonuclease G